MVTMTIYVDNDIFCWIVNTLNKSFVHKCGEDANYKLVSLKMSKKCPYEIQVPIQIIKHFSKDGMAKIDLFALQTLNERKDVGL